MQNYLQENDEMATKGNSVTVPINDKMAKTSTKALTGFSRFLFLRSAHMTKIFDENEI